MVNKIKTDVDNFWFKKKKFNFTKYFGNFFSIIKTKSSLSTPVFIFSIISQILKIKFNVSRTHKHVETGTSCSHELPIFCKYHMPVNQINDIFDHIRIQ